MASAQYGTIRMRLVSIAAVELQVALSWRTLKQSLIAAVYAFHCACPSTPRSVSVGRSATAN